METISELRGICRKKHKKGVSKPHWWAILFARRVSIYITWLIVNHTKISANQVTIWQLISSVLGLGLLCFANSWIALAGVVLLHLGYIFDNVDGEIARYRKTQSINGLFLDLVNHIIISPMVFVSLSFHFYFSTGFILYFVLGIANIVLTFPSIASARYSAINYLIIKRRSPSYDVSTYQFNNKKTASTDSINSPLGGRMRSVLTKLRKIMGEVFSYPNDVIIVSALILTELITGDTFFGSLSLIFFTMYFAGNFILDVYVHLKNKVAEREFFNYVRACLEIAEKVKPVETGNDEQMNNMR